MLRAQVVIKTSNMVISRCCFSTEDDTEFFWSACCTCGTLIFHHSINQILNLCHCRCRLVRRCWSSLFFPRGRQTNVYQNEETHVRGTKHAQKSLFVFSLYMQISEVLFAVAVDCSHSSWSLKCINFWKEQNWIPSTSCYAFDSFFLLVWNHYFR